MDNTIGEGIDTRIDSKLRNLPYPVKCKITRVYEDGFVNVETDIGTLSYVECIGNNVEIGNTGVLIFLNGKANEYIVITK